MVALMMEEKDADEDALTHTCFATSDNLHIASRSYETRLPDHVLKHVYRRDVRCNRDWRVSHALDFANLVRERLDFDSVPSGWEMSHVIKFRILFAKSISFLGSVGSWDTFQRDRHGLAFTRATTIQADISRWITKLA